jgi:hypothetical protein
MHRRTGPVREQLLEAAWVVPWMRSTATLRHHVNSPITAVLRPYHSPPRLVAPLLVAAQSSPRAIWNGSLVPGAITPRPCEPI